MIAPVAALSANLPRPRTSLVGRERIIPVLADLVRRDDVPLLTLTGPGGVGKTRLAVRVAAEVADHYPGGVDFVALAPIVDPALVLPTLATTFGVHDADATSLVARIADALGDSVRLLVLDNFEQILEAGPALAALLAACPNLTLLVTSRVRLRLSSERIYLVPSLELPPAGGRANPGDIERAEAVRLFVERAQAVDPAFAVTTANAAPVAAICGRLDGVPLAIELAAARVAVLPPAALLARLDRALPLLTGGARDQPPRLRSMRDAIGWSHDLLDASEKALFRRLAVFAGGCTLEAAEAVASGAGVPASDVLVGLSSLVDKSLLQRTTGPEEAPRFGMLETVREYGLEQLARSGEEDATRRSHAAWCIALADDAARLLQERDERFVLARLEADHDNIRAALAWAVAEGEPEIAQRIAGALWAFWMHDHLREGLTWLERALAAEGGVPASPAARTRALHAAAMLHSMAGDYDGSIPLGRESLALARAAGDVFGAAAALNVIGRAALARRDDAEAKACFDESSVLYRSIGAWQPLGYVLLNRGVVAADRRHAKALVEEAVALFGQIGYRGSMLALALSNLGHLARGAGDVERAAAHFKESLELCWAGRYAWVLPYALEGLGDVALARGERERGARLFGAAEAIRAEAGAAVRPTAYPEYYQAVAAARALLSQPSFAAAWAEGQALPVADVVAEALRVDSRLAADPADVAPPGAASLLSPRERDVLRLVAAGRTDREIADALFVSHHTVANHVRHILDKLDVSTRAAAVAAATAAGLL